PCRDSLGLMRWGFWRRRPSSLRYRFVPDKLWERGAWAVHVGERFVLEVGVLDERDSPMEAEAGRVLVESGDPGVLSVERGAGESVRLHARAAGEATVTCRHPGVARALSLPFRVHDEPFQRLRIWPVSPVYTGGVPRFEARLYFARDPAARPRSFDAAAHPDTRWSTSAPQHVALGPSPGELIAGADGSAVVSVEAEGRTESRVVGVRDGDLFVVDLPLPLELAVPGTTCAIPLERASASWRPSARIPLDAIRCHPGDLAVVEQAQEGLLHLRALRSGEGELRVSWNGAEASAPVWVGRFEDARLSIAFPAPDPGGGPHILLCRIGEPQRVQAFVSSERRRARIASHAYRDASPEALAVSTITQVLGRGVEWSSDALAVEVDEHGAAVVHGIVSGTAWLHARYGPLSAHILVGVRDGNDDGFFNWY
ncbi:MAG TPA: hypothetical protein VIL20_05955, partial [Sandaracinaceae bacterium]